MSQPPAVDAPPSLPVPTWFDRLVGLLVAAVLGIGAVGTALAAVGWYQVGVVIVFGLMVAYSVFSLREGFDAPDPWSSAGSAPAAAVLVAAVGAAVLIGWFPSQAQLPGPQAATIALDAAQLRATGETGFEGLEAEWGDAPLELEAPGFVAGDAGFESAGPPFSASWRAAVLWMGNAYADRLGALLAGVALLSFFGFAARMVAPWMAVLMTGALAINPAVVHLARDTSPALPALALVFGGLTALWDDHERWRSRRGVLAGILFGAAAIAGIEWLLLALPMTAWLVHETRLSAALPWTARRRKRRFLAAIAATYGLVVVLATGVALLTGSAYLDASGMAPGWLVPGLVVAAAAGLALPARGDGGGRWAAALAALVVIGGVLILGLLRPLTAESTGTASPVVAALQQEDGLPVDGIRTYAEDSALWLGWYAGPVAAVAGAIAWALLAGRAAGWGAGRTGPILFVVLGVSVVWLLRPGIDPVQVEVMARFVPLTIPALLVGAGWLADRLWRMESGPVELWQLAAMVIVGGSILLPAWYLVDTYDLATQRDAPESVAALCDGVGRDAAVVVAGPDGLAAQAPLALRVWCGVPAASVTEPLSDSQLAELADGWAPTGRRLVVVGERAGALRLGDLSYRSLERRLDDRPRREIATTHPLYITERPAG